MIKKICETPSPSGREDALKDVIIDYVKDFSDIYFSDSFSNLVFIKKGVGKRILVECGLDEPFVMVSSDNKKNLKFAVLPHFKTDGFVGKNMCFKDGETVKIKSETKENISFFNLYSKSEIKRCIGEFLTEEAMFKSDEMMLFSNNIKYKAPLYIMCEIMKELKNTPYEIYFVFSLQKCLAMRGIKAFLRTGISFDAAISLSCLEECEDFKTGDGAIIIAKEKSCVPSVKLRRKLSDCAKKYNVLYKTVLTDVNINSRVFITEGQGTVHSVLAIPFSPKKGVLKKDIDMLKTLVVSALKGEEI